MTGDDARPTDPLAVRADAPDALETPPAHLELRWRPLVPGDAAALGALVEAAPVGDGRALAPSVARALAGGTTVDLPRDTLGGFDEAGVLRAYGVVRLLPDDRRTVRVLLSGAVHPAWRGRGVGRAVLAWMEGRGRQRLAGSGTDLPARLMVRVDERRSDQRRLYAAAGFSPVRWCTPMRREVGTPLPDLVVPAGVELVPWSPGVDEQVRRAHDEAFADRWGFEAPTAQAWQDARAGMEPRLSVVAVDRSGAREEVAGYAVSRRLGADGGAHGGAGVTELLGVRPAWRGRRLATALLTWSLHAYRDAGLDEGRLTLDSAEPGGAHRLCEGLGYAAAPGEVLYSVEI